MSRLKILAITFEGHDTILRKLNFVHFHFVNKILATLLKALRSNNFSLTYLLSVMHDFVMERRCNSILVRYQFKFSSAATAQRGNGNC